MGVRLPLVTTSTVLGSPIVTTTETVVATLPALNPSFDAALVAILFLVNMTVGASATQALINIRRGTLVTSPVVSGLPNTNVTAGVNALLLWLAFDSGLALAGVQYSASIAMTAATGNTTINAVSMTAFML